MITKEIPNLMKYYPFATAYILGAYDLDVKDIFMLSSITNIEKIFDNIESSIKFHHKDWVLDEVYYRGFDFAEALEDSYVEVKLEENDIYDVSSAVEKYIIKQTKHNMTIVMSTYNLGKKYII